QPLRLISLRRADSFTEKVCLTLASASSAIGSSLEIRVVTFSRLLSASGRFWSISLPHTGFRSPKSRALSTCMSAVPTLPDSARFFSSVVAMSVSPLAELEIEIAHCVGQIQSSVAGLAVFEIAIHFVAGVLEYMFDLGIREPVTLL